MNHISILTLFIIAQKNLVEFRMYFFVCLRSLFMRSSFVRFCSLYCCCSSKKDRVAYQIKIIFLPAFWWLLWHSHHKIKYLTKNSIIMLSSCVVLISISRKDHNCHINLHFTFSFIYLFIHIEYLSFSFLIL